MTVKPLDRCRGYGVVQELIGGTREYARAVYVPEPGKCPDGFI